MFSAPLFVKLGNWLGNVPGFARKEVIVGVEVGIGEGTGNAPKPIYVLVNVPGDRNNRIQLNICSAQTVAPMIVLESYSHQPVVEHYADDTLRDINRNSRNQGWRDFVAHHPGWLRPIENCESDDVPDSPADPPGDVA